MKKALVFGEIIWDVYPEKAEIGGAPLNFAAHAAQFGLHCTFVSAVGRDRYGEDAATAVRRFGIDDRYLEFNSYPTGQCLVKLDEKRVPTFHVVENVAYDHITLTAAERAQLVAEPFDALYFGTLIQRSAGSRGTLRDLLPDLRIPNVVCDVNLRKNCYDADSVSFCLNHATILKISGEEEPLLREMGFYSVPDGSPETIAKALCARFPNLRTVLLTLGADGSFVYSAETGEQCRQPAVGETVVSTVGAGDSYTAAWLAKFLNGAGAAECTRKAAEVSGFVVAHRGSVPEITFF